VKAVFKNFFLIRLGALLFTLGFSFPTMGEKLEKVSLQLDWKYQFQFAGFIAAKEKGFYKDVGLDVDLIEYKNGTDVFEDVLSQKATYGINKSSIYVRDKKIVPISLLASYFQKSPHVLVTSKEIKSPNDLRGKVIMISKRNLVRSSVAQLFAHFYINPENTTFVDQADSVDALINHQVDAISVYSTNEPFYLEQSNVEFNIIDPDYYGYGSGAGHLFTSPHELEEHPERTKNFIEASNKGWAYALAHQDEIISIIYAKYSLLKSIESLRFEAVATEKLMKTELKSMASLGFVAGAAEKSSVVIGSIKQGTQQKLVKQLKRSLFLDNDQFLSSKHHDAFFSQQQLDYLINKKEITYCATPSWMPMEGIENGQHIGFTGDLFEHFREHLPVPLRLVDTSSWTETLIKAKNRECDLITWATKTPSRLTYFDFSSPYLETPIVMVTRMDTLFVSEIKNVRDKKLGIVKNYAPAEKLRKQVPGINIIEVDSMEEGLALVEKGELFGFIDNSMVMAKLLQRTYHGTLKVSARLDFKSSATVATRNDEPILHDVFEQLVTHIPEPELQAIYNKWVTIQQDPVVDYSVAWKVLVGMLILTLAYFYYYLRLKRLKDKLLLLSITDKLTGLYNRAKLDEVISHEKARLDRYDSVASLILMDLDFFKAVNDNFGHLTGDRVLIEFSNIIKKNVRTTDAVGRWGGEEFLVVCPKIGIKAATELAEKLSAIVRAHSFSGVGHITFSAGVSQFSRNDGVETTLKNADKALYYSKDAGRDKVTRIDQI